MKFLIVYSALDNNKEFYGNVACEITNYPLTLEQVRKIEEEIRHEGKFSSVVITNIMSLR